MDHPGLDIRIGARAIKRLLLVFLIACALLSILYTSRDRLSQIGYSVEVQVAEEVSSGSGTYDDYVELDLPEPDQVEPLTDINQQSCAARRNFYTKLLESRTSERLLRYDKEGNLNGRPFVLSSTQPLFSENCYSSEERLHPLRHAVDDSVNLCNAVVQPHNRTTVVLRLESDNLFTEDAVFNLRRLVVEVGWALGWDINVLQITGPEYNPDKVPVEFRRLLTNYQRDEVFDGYPEATEAKTKNHRIDMNYQDNHGSRYATAYYQFPQVWFMDQHDYSFAYFLDSHARHTSSYGDLFTALGDVQKGVDLLTLDPILLTRPSVFWTPSEASLPQSYYHTRLIVHGISANMTRAMKGELMAGTNAAHEAFMPAVAIKRNLNIAMFAHPIMKKKDALLFETYAVPEERDWQVHNLKDAQEDERARWQFGGTYAADAGKWKDDLPRTKWIDNLYQTWRHEKEVCLPGLLMYPVSGR